MRGLNIGRGSPWGNPVKIGQKCPVCRGVHPKAGDTIPCFKKYLWGRLKRLPKAERIAREVGIPHSRGGMYKLLLQLEGEELWCPGCGTDSPTCHGRALEGALKWISTPGPAQCSGDMLKEKADAYCVTTNNVVKQNGRAVMGAGVAKAVRDHYPGIDLDMAAHLEEKGHHAGVIWPSAAGPDVVSFPTKHHWRNKSSLELIRQSCQELMLLIHEKQWTRVILPPPGCGNGGLSFKEEVEPILQEELDKRVWVIHYQ